MALGGFGMNIDRCGVASCMEIGFFPTNFFSKYPGMQSPVWNLITLFPPLIWGLVLICLILMVMFFSISSKFYEKIGMEKYLIHEEILLVPIRYHCILLICFQL